MFSYSCIERFAFWTCAFSAEIWAHQNVNLFKQTGETWQTAEKRYKCFTQLCTRTNSGEFAKFVRLRKRYDNVLFSIQMQMSMH